MKKRFLIVLSMIFVFGLFATVFALNRTNANAEKTISCPMQNSQTTQTAENMDMSKVTVFVSGDDCCQPGADCCKGGACCKKKK